MEENLKVKCPVCNIFFELEEAAEEGDLTTCPECEAELKVNSLTPPEVYQVEYEQYGPDMEADTEDSDLLDEWEEETDI